MRCNGRVLIFIVIFNSFEKEIELGQFGPIYKGVWINYSGFLTDVSIKSLRENATDVEMVKLLQEAAIMAQFRHPNLVSLYGISMVT